MIWPDLSQLHFIRPLWLLGIPALFTLWLLLSRLRNVTLWEEFIPKDKLDALQVTRGRYSKSWRQLLMLGWLITIIGASGPSWRQVEVPTVRNESAMVIVLDLSQSMLAQDLTPDRLSRAKYKLIDLLRSRADGQTALVAYAGDAHTVAPLTDDASTIEVLLPALHPAIMPIAGSNAEAAIELAQRLMIDAGITSGKIIMLTDGIAAQARDTISRDINPAFPLSILGVGTSDPVPIPDDQGGFVRDSSDEIVLVGVDRAALSNLSQSLGGRYVDIQTDNSDVLALTNASDIVSDTGESSLVYDSWEDVGYWLVLLVLPFAAFSFRKGVFFLIPLCAMTLMVSFSPQPVYAQEQGQNNTKFTGSLWKTPDQRGAELLEQGEAQAAANTFERADWAAVANYRAGDFEKAAETFNQFEGAEAQYNLGNALAFAGQLEQAIEAYDKALETAPEMEDALHNKAVVEKLLEQQESQEQQDQSDSDQEPSDENSEGDPNQDSGQPQDQNSDDQNEGSENQPEPSDEGETDPAENEESQNENSEEQESPEDENETPEDETEQPDSQDEQEEQEEQNEPQEAPMTAEETPEDLDESSERWLRGIPDDPSGFLRRKFEYESERARQEQRLTPNNQSLGSERY